MIIPPPMSCGSRNLEQKKRVDTAKQEQGRKASRKERRTKLDTAHALVDKLLDDKAANAHNPAEYAKDPCATFLQTASRTADKLESDAARAVVLGKKVDGMLIRQCYMRTMYRYG